jgi:hypothetical protein
MIELEDQLYGIAGGALKGLTANTGQAGLQGVSQIPQINYGRGMNQNPNYSTSPDRVKALGVDQGSSFTQKLGAPSTGFDFKPNQAFGTGTGYQPIGFDAKPTPTEGSLEDANKKSSGAPNTGGVTPSYGGFRGWVDIGSMEEPNIQWFNGPGYNDKPAAATEEKAVEDPIANEPGNTGGPMPIDPRTGAPQPYDNNTMIGQLLNNAAAQQYGANSRYNNLFDQSAYLSNGQVDYANQAADSSRYYAGLAENSLGEAGTDLGSARGALGTMNDVLGDARTAGDPWYDRASGAYDQAGGFINQMGDTLNAGRGVNEYYDNSTRDAITQSRNLLTTGEIPQAIQDAMLGTVNRQLNSSMGDLLTNMGGRGVVNSSVTGSGINQLSQNAANAFQDSYSDNLFNLINGWDQSANTSANAGKAFSDAYLNMATGYGNAANSARGLGDSLRDTGSKRVGDLLGVAGGYGNLATGYQNNATGWQNNAAGYNTTGKNLSDALLGTSDAYGNSLKNNLLEREALMNEIPKYWENASSSLNPILDYLYNQQQDRARDTQTTVVNQKQGLF